MHPPDLTSEKIEATLLTLIRQRGPLASACPSEIARQLAPDDWRALMPRVREVAALLAQQGFLEIAQGGKAISPRGPWRGPIRIRLPSTGPTVA